MTSNKDRLYIALFARGGLPKMLGQEDTYHWALLVGPKKEDGNSAQGMQYHAKETVFYGKSSWMYEEVKVPLHHTNSVLVRIMLGKIKDLPRFETALRNIPVRQAHRDWNCVYWIKEALETACMDRRSVGSCVVEWSTVRARAMEFVQRKRDEHRFEGPEGLDMPTPPTYDLVREREIIG